MIEIDASGDGITQITPAITHAANGKMGKITGTGSELTSDALPGASNSSTSSTAPNPSAHRNFPPPKTDKPRPHVCATCTRSFARLEHLKRHERSHTKEKPFECPECARCFARRDLLLRHQQKLHSTTTPSSRPRGGRRESAAGVGGGRVRKNSAAINGGPGPRPRANTLSHIDTSTIGMLVTHNLHMPKTPSKGHNHHNSLGGLPGVAGFEYRGISNGNHAGLNGPHALPRLETSLAAELSGGLRTAPPYAGLGAEFEVDLSGHDLRDANTVNPHALHLHGSNGLGVEVPASPFQQVLSSMAGGHVFEDETNFDWIAHGFENQLSFAPVNESAIEASSPSAMSTNSPGNSEAVRDGAGLNGFMMPVSASPMWMDDMVSQPQLINGHITLDYPASVLNEMLPVPLDTVSPKSLLAQNSNGTDIGFSMPPPLSSLESPGAMPVHLAPTFQLPFGRNHGRSSGSTSSMDSSQRKTSMTSVSSELINEYIRDILVATLSQTSAFGHHKYSHTSRSSPPLPALGSRTQNVDLDNFPSVQDLQRYVSAYVQFFHPHLPFMHIPTLNFESPEYTTPLRRVGGHSQFVQSSVPGGGACLILSIAAIGAVYEDEMPISRELFECARTQINFSLDERSNANMAKAYLGTGHSVETEGTPLWLVQAMLLNVIYRHNCGDEMAPDTASQHCAALVSLAREAELAAPGPAFAAKVGDGMQPQDMHLYGMVTEGWNVMMGGPDDSDWHAWKTTEERKRTLYAVFIVSSLLVSAYNRAPALTNSEIRLDLPCDEAPWCAENVQAWRAMGGAPMVEAKSVPFGAALGHLLTAAQRQQRPASNPAGSSLGSDLSDSELTPSSFGCLVLVNALHNYIWETRQRHLGRPWTNQETEQMHAHIEPALRAWQAAWASHPTHSLERPNPFGVGPLSADSIPLLDLAYVRLYVNLGHSKEAFWQRDHDTMVGELSRGVEMVPQVVPSPCSGSDQTAVTDLNHASSSRQGSMVDAPQTSPGRPHSPGNPFRGSAHPSQRERRLRRAAFYAADSLSMADTLGIGFADHTSRELPLQSAMCAFDCAQVLAEWVTTVQERVGRHLGIIGQDEINLVQVPGIIFLEDEDRKLLEKVEEVLKSAEHALNGESNLDMGASSHGGYASKILMWTAYMLGRAAVWPGKITSSHVAPGHLTDGVQLPN